MQQKKAETDQLYNTYQKEKEKQRRQDSQNLSDFHLKQAVINKFEKNPPKL